MTYRSVWTTGNGVLSSFTNGFHEGIGMHYAPRLFLSALIVAVTAALPLFAADDSGGEPFSIGVYLGPSIPSASIEQVYNTLDTLGIGAAYQSASSLGFHLGAKLRFGLNDAFSFSGGLQFTQFPGQDQTATLDDGTRCLLQTVTTFVPFYAGFTFIPIKRLVRPYISAEAMYTYKSVSIATRSDIFENLIVGQGQELEPKTARGGAAFTGGVEFNLGGLKYAPKCLNDIIYPSIGVERRIKAYAEKEVQGHIILHGPNGTGKTTLANLLVKQIGNQKPFIELKYNMTNLVGKSDGEETMSFLNVSLGLVF